MNKSRNILSFLGVALLAISLPISLYILKTGNLDFRISAFESDEPVHVVISDVTNNTFKVSWITEKPVYGAVKLTNNVEPITESTSTSYHTVTIKNLDPASNYQFQMLSNGKAFEKTYSVKSAAISNTNANQWIYGQIFAKDGVSTQRGGTISVTLTTGSNTSQVLSTVINETGGYKINLGSVLNSALSSAFNTKTSTTLTFLIYSEFDTEPVKKTFTLDLSKESQIPNIYLGDINIDVIPGVPGN